MRLTALAVIAALMVLGEVAAESGEHYGLLGMQERTHQAGGKLSITTHPGGGTAVEVVVPVTSGK